MMSKNKIKNQNIGILGFGEVGQAIAKFYKNPRLRKRFGGRAKIKDLERDDGLRGVEILNICIPWGDRFIEIVKKEIKEIKPRLTIIHSTVAPGTTKKLSSLFRDMVVHSPIRGIHPKLFEGIKTFVKYIGADNKKAGEMAKKHLESLGIKTKVFYPSATTELGKLLDTTYYGIVIAWHGEMEKICKKFGVDFDQAITDFNRTYNEGYKKIGKLNVIRPVLYPPEGGCGGHCVLENTVLLRESRPEFSQILNFILSMGKHKNSISGEKIYFNKNWLYAEYWGKEKSAEKIAKEQGCTGSNILAIMKRRNIPIRDRKWTNEQIKKVLKLSEEGKTFKDISEEMEKDKKTYDAIRNVAYKNLKIKSSYNPAIRNEETRQKISASLQGIELENWDGFKESLNSLIRKSVKYQEWREKIFERDNYTCQKCDKRGVFLIAHHIKNFANNLDWRIKIDNGITLCKRCHLGFHNKYGRINNSEKQIKEYLKE